MSVMPGIGATAGALRMRSIDQFFDATILLLNGEGANGGTVISDGAAKTAPLTRAGNTSTSTTQKKYGVSSLRFDGTGDYLTNTDASFWELGTGDFTIEFWMYIDTTSTGDQGVLDLRSSGASGCPFFDFTSNIQISLDGGSRWSFARTNFAWKHYAMTRQGNTFRMFLDGVKQGSDYVSAVNLTGSNLTLGTYHDRRDTGTTFHFLGYLDDVRITKGVARYVANFSPPTELPGVA